MLNAVCFLPATPLLVPRMGGAAAGETEELRRAVLAAVGSVAGPAAAWTVLGVGPARLYGDPVAQAAVGCGAVLLLLGQAWVRLLVAGVLRGTS